MTNSNLPKTLGDRIPIDYCRECRYPKKPENNLEEPKKKSRLNSLFHYKLRLDNGKYIDLYECKNNSCKASLYLFDYNVLDSSKINVNSPSLIEFKDEYLELMMRVKKFFKARKEEKSLELSLMD